MFAQTSYGRSARVYGPVAAQSEWHNVTGNWVPVLNVETNFNSYGGGPLTAKNGTDPRMNDLVGAAWLGSLLVDSSEQNVSALAYFALTSSANLTNTVTNAYGGFGFGMTNVTTGGAIRDFAPYFVMKLWDTYIPHGAEGLSYTSSDTASVEVYAVMVGGTIHVAIVDRVGLPIRIHVTVPGFSPAQHATVIDPTSYVEQYNALTSTTSIVRAGWTSVGLSNGAFGMAGYGFAILTFTPLVGGGPPPGP